MTTFIAICVAQLGYIDFSVMSISLDPGQSKGKTVKELWVDYCVMRKEMGL